MKNKRVILRELARLDIAYGGRKTGEELDILAEMFFEECGFYSEDVFVAACKAHLRGSDYFPTVAQLLEHCRMEHQLQNRRIIRADDPELLPSEDQAEINRKGIAMLRDRLARRLSVNSEGGCDGETKDLS